MLRPPWPPDAPNQAQSPIGSKTARQSQDMRAFDRRVERTESQDRCERVARGMGRALQISEMAWLAESEVGVAGDDEESEALCETYLLLRRSLH